MPHRFTLLIATLIALLQLAGCAAIPAPRTPDAVGDLIPSAPPPAPSLPQPKAPPVPVPTSSQKPPTPTALRSMGYSTQVGAFSRLDYAVRLEANLQKKGIDAFYFLHESGLYKVRFGNHATYQDARSEAENLRIQGLIEEFFIVIPEEYMAARIRRGDHGDLREELVKTARRFLGTPYRWGGTTVDDGFDCSGLTLVSYRLNGLDLPRVSYNQFEAGQEVPRDQLQKGDLVFFATRGGGKVSHVGMYIGNNQFIHAPRTGKTVRIESLSNGYYQRTFMGGRTYL